MRIPSSNQLHHFLSLDSPYHRKIARACGLHSLPDRRTFDRGFKILPLQDMASKMGERFIAEGLMDARTVCIDSSMIHASKRLLWHVKDMVRGIVPVRV